MEEKIIKRQESNAITRIAGAYVRLLKPRLTVFVALSAVMGVALASGGAASALQLLIIGLSGLLITGGSNVLNQVFEKDLDALMTRTANRPLPTAQVGIIPASIYGVLLGIIGVGLLGIFFNLPAALLGIIGYLGYAFVYTPLKRFSPFAVFVGAIPGALPPLIGWVAWTGEIAHGGMILFAIQFFWQFPHFWAIAWLMDEDYKKAGFKMLPTPQGRSKNSSRLILIYTLFLIPLAAFPWLAGISGIAGTVVVAILGVGYSLFSLRLHRSQDMKDARKLLFASFAYLPLALIALLIG